MVYAYDKEQKWDLLAMIFIYLFLLTSSNNRVTNNYTRLFICCLLVFIFCVLTWACSNTYYRLHTWSITLR
ncbi:hypothetical protein J3Q64DRAFT_1734761 [Phycomyces blakesleeanus]|uniref:Uncharacterized protein n=1 Tax=Phycomyces blakesleeanus TaxID=4837 RepID=A0ABR3B2N9_PHYBL